MVGGVMADRSELLFSLVGVVGRDVQRVASAWDGFGVLARFDTATPSVRTWYYRSGDPRAFEVASAPQALAVFEQLRAAVEVPAEPVRVGVLTHVKASGVTDLQLLSAPDDIAGYVGVADDQVGLRLYPRGLV